MKRLLVFALIGILAASCEEDPDTMLEVKPIPVIYGVVNRYDTINHFYLTKTFSGDPFGADFNAGIPDSIYFKGATVDIQVFETNPKVTGGRPRLIDTLATPTVLTGKQSGKFCYPDVPVFILNYDLDSADYMLFHFFIPGYDSLHFKLVPCKTPRLISPGPVGSMIRLLPWDAAHFTWDGAKYSDLNVRFIIKTTFQSGDSRHDTLLYTKREVVRESGVFRTRMTYDNFLSMVNRTLRLSHEVNYRQIVDINSEIWTSADQLSSRDDAEFSPLNNDYSFTQSSGIKVFQTMTSKARVYLSRIQLDPSTVDYMSRDTALTRFKFKFY